MPPHLLKYAEIIRTLFSTLRNLTLQYITSRRIRRISELSNNYIKYSIKTFCWCSFVLYFSIDATASDKIVFARNGAGQELIENSLPAIVLAASRNVQILELHINMTQDGELILFKDTTLNRLTDTAEKFPLKIRENGSYYVIDFTLSEIRQLRIKNVIGNDPNGLSLSVPTLGEALNLIQRLEVILGHAIGFSIEPAEPQFYLENNKDISEAIIDTLISFGYPKKPDNFVYFQSNDADELQRIHNSILPAKQVIFPLIQLVNEPEEDNAAFENQGDKSLFDHDWLFTNIGLRLIASYASAIALPDSLVFSQEGTVLRPQYLEKVKKYGIKLLIASTKQLQVLPMYKDNLPALLDLYYDETMADGVYTDDYAAAQLYNRTRAEQVRRRGELPEFFSNLNLTPPTPKDNDSAPAENPKKDPDY